jgi:hypothetical protein
MIASATNGAPVEGSGSMHALQHPLRIPLIILRFLDISPALIVANLGIIPGFFTMYFLEEAG